MLNAPRLLLLLAAATSLGLTSSVAQTVGQPAAQTSTPRETTPAPRPRPARRAQPTQTIPIETAPSVPATNQTPAQKAADQQLLQQQQAQSDHAARVNNQIVDKAQKQQEQAQSQTRVEDAPGPSQTGLVPAAGAPVAPTQGDTRIQDAPGPAQTLPSLPSTTPSQLPATPTIPAQSTQPPPQ